MATPKAFFAQVREQVAKESKGYPAPLEIVACAEAAATKPFDEGRKEERERFNQLVVGNESKALRHMFFAERQTSKIPDVPEDTPVRELKKAAVIGAGTMGGGIAMNFANAGIPVTLIDMNQAARGQRPGHHQEELRGHRLQGAAQAGGHGQAHGADQALHASCLPTPTSSSKRCSSAWT